MSKLKSDWLQRNVLISWVAFPLQYQYQKDNKQLTFFQSMYYKNYSHISVCFTMLLNMITMLYKQQQHFLQLLRVKTLESQAKSCGLILDLYSFFISPFNQTIDESDVLFQNISLNSPTLYNPHHYYPAPSHRHSYLDYDNSLLTECSLSFHS